PGVSNGDTAAARGRQVPRFQGLPARHGVRTSIVAPFIPAIGAGHVGTAGDAVNAVKLARVGIAVGAFSLPAHLIYNVTAVLLFAARRQVVDTDEGWPEKLDIAVSVAALALGLRVALAAARRLWPSPTVQDFVSEREAADAKRRAADSSPAADR